MKFINKKRAFTLIELMIVVVILGILMSTILPKLTGAQARSRDAGRIADLENITNAMEIHHHDYGLYPERTSRCISKDSGYVNDRIKKYIQNGIIPQDPQSNANVSLCNGGITDDYRGSGRYFYSSISKTGMDHNGMILCADMETRKKANTDARDITSAISGNENAVINTAVDENGNGTNDDYEDVVKQIGKYNRKNPFPESIEDTDAGRSIYCILR